MYDSTQGTAANRYRIYKNNVEQATTKSPGISLNEENRLFKDTASMFIGNRPANFVAKSLAFIDVLEGIAAVPGDFAFNNGGIWTRKKYAGSYGSYGFSLDGTDGFNDVSGNGQDFSGTNMTTADNLDPGDLPPYTS